MVLYNKSSGMSGQLTYECMSNNLQDVVAGSGNPAFRELFFVASFIFGCLDEMVWYPLLLDMKVAVQPASLFKIKMAGNNRL